MNIYWLEQSSADVPSDNDWLSVDESLCLNTMRFTKRRTDWRLGRWTAKCAISLCLNVPQEIKELRRIEVVAEPSGAPESYLDNEPAKVSISISHCDGTAICAVAPSRSMGCDLEMIEPRSDAFMADYFTPEEQAFFVQAPPEDLPRLLTLHWSAKESALKALRTGLRLDTRTVSVNSDSAVVNDWHRLSVSFIGDPSTSARHYEGWWQTSGRFVRTVVAHAMPNPPIRLLAPVFQMAELAGARPDRPYYEH